MDFKNEIFEVSLQRLAQELNEAQDGSTPQNNDQAYESEDRPVFNFEIYSHRIEQSYLKRLE